jgi:prepilin-type processing-associated H-X9-DG protein
MYGDPINGSTGAGVFQVAPGQRLGGPIPPLQSSLLQVTDGTAYTMMLSEGLIGRSSSPSVWGGPLGDIQTSAMGGSLFSALDLPNSPAPDRVLGPCPQAVGDTSYPAPCFSFGAPSATAYNANGARATARSRHSRGVNVAMADGSVRFVSNDVSGAVWRAQSTRAGNEPASDTAVPRRQTKQVLFIGNSYTANMPSLVAALWQASGSGTVNIQTHWVGGATLQAHYQSPTAMALINSGGWDYVVLQGQSQEPCFQPYVFFQYARLLDAAIKKSGGKTMFFLTPAHAGVPLMQTQLTNAYQTIARELGASIAPVGIAWEDSLSQRPDIALHLSDGSHPSDLGIYLNACVFYSVLSGNGTDNLPLTGPNGTIPDDPGKFLRQLAGTVSSSWR